MIAVQETYARFMHLQRIAFSVGIAAAIASLGGLLVAGKTQFFQSYHFAYMVWVCLTLGTFGLTLLHHTVRGIWSLPVLRFAEAGAATLPLMLLLFVPIVIGLSDIYPWARAEVVLANEHLQHKTLYLNVPFFLVRAAVYFAVWIGLASILRRWSLQQDQTQDETLAQKRTNLSAPGLVLFVLTVTFAMFDWSMSLEPLWQSAIYGAWFIVGQGLSALAFLTVVLLLAARHKPFADVLTPKLMRDLGNMTFAFVILWAYTSISQYLIIWSANLPEEIVYYVKRNQGGWQYLSAGLIVLQFFLPFLILLSSRVKRYSSLLLRVMLFILVMRVVDLFWIITPAFGRQTLQVHWLDVTLLATIGGFWLAWFARQVRAAPLLARHDTRLQEAWQYEYSAPSPA
jgi:hypothetical protein